MKKLSDLNLLESLRLPVTVACAFWLVEIMEFSADIDINTLGIFPRTLKGLPGIVFSPFLHGDFKHLINNTPSFIVLSTAILAFYPRYALQIIGLIYLSTGVGVWLFARPAYHIGASGLVYGFAAFLFFHGLFQRDGKSLGISLAVAFLFNGMLYGVFPVEQGVSWESHLIGAICGAVTAFAYRNNFIAPIKDTNEMAQASLETSDGFQKLESLAFKYEFQESENEKKAVFLVED